MTELAADNRRVVCATCGTALGEAAVPQTEPANQRNSRAQEARELLNRWANGRPVDPFGPPRKRVFEDVLQTAPAEAVTTAAASVDAPRVSEVPRTDAVPAAQPLETRPNDAQLNADLDRLTNEILARVEKIGRESTAKSPTTEAASFSTTSSAGIDSPVSIPPSVPDVISAAAPNPAPPIHRIDAATLRLSEAHLATPFNQQPQADAQPACPQSSASPLLWVATARKNFGLMHNIGQGLSYVGILGITLGLSLVVLGTFGASSHLAPTGWLIATLGQMLLLLGVVTSVTVGMEQSSAEMRLIVDERMRLLSEQIEQLRQQPTRVDQAHAEIPAPHFTTQPKRERVASSVENK